MSNYYLCIHGHFYQPPRADPFTGHIPREPDAAPYANWNERITAECYAPNAKGSNWGHISFNLGGTLARWLDEHAHATYERIVDAEQGYWQTHGVSNGLAQPVHHTILPLARRRDKICQVRWGIASFEHRFGHRTEGIWLPEMAVDYETLEILAAEGIRFTILSDEQVRGDLSAGAGPYRVRLPGGGEIAVFVRDRHLANTLSFNMPDPDHVDDWLRDQIGWRRDQDKLLLIATDGETFGHHHRQGVQVLSRILEAGDAHGYELTTLGLYLRQHPPQAEPEVIEKTAWSCAHRLDRWAIGCGCTPGDSRWKGALRRALDNLASDLDHVYLCESKLMGIAAWPLRDDYIAVVLGQMDGPTLLTEHDLGHLNDSETQRLLRLLEAQFYRQRMYASCTFFFEDLNRLEPRYAIANGVRAIALTRYATGDNLSNSFRRDLSMAVSERGGRTGADILDKILEKAEV
jgi:alpha-amylase/alpha-mannosidase (GH57 family)